MGVVSFVRSLHLIFVVVVTGCGFASPDPVPEVIPPGPMPTAQPCRTNEAGVVLCVDFEDDSLVAQASDRSPYQHHAVAHDVERIARPPLLEEHAALMSNVSSLLVRESTALDLTRFTIEMWIRPDQIVKYKGWDRDLGLFDNYGHYAMRLREDLKIRCGIGDITQTRVSSVSAVPKQEWSHVACSYEAGEMRVYLNGHLSDCQDLGVLVPGGNLGSAIGAELERSPLATAELKDRFIGGIDNVRIYDHPLDAARICSAAGQPAGCRNECPTDEDSSGD